MFKHQTWSLWWKMICFGVPYLQSVVPCSQKGQRHRSGYSQFFEKPIWPNAVPILFLKIQRNSLLDTKGSMRKLEYRHIENLTSNKFNFYSNRSMLTIKIVWKRQPATSRWLLKTNQRQTFWLFVSDSDTNNKKSEVTMQDMSNRIKGGRRYSGQQGLRKVMQRR